MKKGGAIVLAMVLVLGFSSMAWAGAEPKTDADVAAIFFGDDLQPYTESDGDEEMLDTFWVYYTDGTFEQFSEAEDAIRLFSTGTYELGEGSDFIYEADETDPVTVIIRRDQKYQAGTGLGAYESEHTYDPGALGFIEIYAPDNSEKKIAAVYYGNDKQLCVEEDGDEEMLDTVWIYFSDGTFIQFAELEDRIELFSIGTYELSEGSDFVYGPDEEDLGQLTINRTEKYQAGVGLAEHISSHTYDLNTLDYDQLLVIAK